MMSEERLRARLAQYKQNQKRLEQGFPNMYSTDSPEVATTSIMIWRIGVEVIRELEEILA